MSILYDSIPPSEMEWLVPLAEKVSAERSLRIQRWIRNHTGMQMPSEVATTIFREAMTCVLHKVHEDSYADVYRKVASILAKNSAAKRKVQAQRKASFEPSLRTKKPTTSIPKRQKPLDRFSLFSDLWQRSIEPVRLAGKPVDYVQANTEQDAGNIRITTSRSKAYTPCVGFLFV